VDDEEHFAQIEAGLMTELFLNLEAELMKQLLDK